MNKAETRTGYIDLALGEQIGVCTNFISVRNFSGIMHKSEVR